MRTNWSQADYLFVAVQVLKKSKKERKNMKKKLANLGVLYSVQQIINFFNERR